MNKLVNLLKSRDCPWRAGSAAGSSGTRRKRRPGPASSAPPRGTCAPRCSLSGKSRVRTWARDKCQVQRKRNVARSFTSVLRVLGSWTEGSRRSPRWRWRGASACRGPAGRRPGKRSPERAAGTPVREKQRCIKVEGRWLETRETDQRLGIGDGVVLE